MLLVGDGEAADAKRRLIEAAGGVVVTALVPGVRLAFVALDAPEAEAARLKAAGLLVNVVDRPALCDFTVPAIVDRSPVLVAVGTGGASASLATALRQRFERLLPARLGALALALRAARGDFRGTLAGRQRAPPQPRRGAGRGRQPRSARRSRSRRRRGADRCRGRATPASRSCCAPPTRTT